MTISADRLAAIEAAALAGCPTLPAQVVELARELRETRRQREETAAALFRCSESHRCLLAACQRLRGWAQSFLMDDHPAVISVDEAIADVKREYTPHG